MTTALQPRGGGGGVGRPNASSLAEVLDTILDKGLVIDAYVRVSLVGIEILTIDARVVVASVDTYLRFAEAVNRLDIASQDQKPGLPDVVKDVASGGKSSATKDAIQSATEQLGKALSDDKGDKGDAKQLLENAGQQILGMLTQDKDKDKDKEEEPAKPTRQTSSRRKTQS
ncbi:gas vesicle protein GvpJ [Nocardia huaxiensis]|uniref:Gas vesicle protein A n=1 Tax=Nocardia huaxiensis TaxID=2755382 RepID=A0A7D6ZL83_9NOCA|nr:gas vesicle protein GvpJ [Nocardia huaxiensis]QLY33919.1 gas vesicle structural protein GvpA [Nocardia huaxiensis]UFS99144.1 gas vesicle structural protein GvpA [Nocardia huaxiensis]